MSKKRNRNELDDECINTELNDSQPPSKRQKLNNESALTISSSLFSNDNDQKQFKQIFKSIDESQLINHLNVSYDIIKEIGEFANGRWEICGNQQCNELISVLHHDEVTMIASHNFDGYEFDEDPIYNEDGEHNKLGYKYCGKTNKYFCIKCIEAVIVHDCTEYGGNDIEPRLLIHKPSSSKCPECGTVTADGCGCFAECQQCNYRWCSDHGELHFCVGCEPNKLFCGDCSVTTPYSEFNAQCVCNECYAKNAMEIMLTCKKCEISFELIHEKFEEIKIWDANTSAYKVGMKKCSKKGCNIWICFNCKEENRIGRFYYHTAYVLCNHHFALSDKYCWSDFR